MSLNGCGGTDKTTVELDMPAEQCVPGHHEACWCMSGATGHQVCREDGMAYGHCECPDDSGGDAGTNPEASTEDAGTEPDADADAEADAGTELDAAVDAEIDVESDAQADAGVDAEADAETDAVADTGSYDELIIYDDGHPQPTIVIAGSDVWRPFSRYKACAKTENVRIKIISPQCLDANNESATHATDEVGVAVGGALQGTSGLTGGNDFLDVYLGDGFIVPASGCVKFEIWAKMKDVQPHSVCTYSHGPCSGQALKIRVGHSAQDYWTDAGITPEWYGKVFIHAFGEVSGKQIYAAQGASEPSFMVVRKSKPVVTPQPFTNTVLSSGEREIARWQVGADSAGSIAVKQLPFYTEWSAGVSLSSFRLYRGAFQIPLTDYSIVDMSTGADLKATSVSSILGAYPTVAFVDEEVVSGTGNLYSLRATVTASGVGHHINTKFINPGSGNITGVLVNNVNLMPPEVASPYLWHVQEPGDGYGVGTFLWSDLSEVPHGTASYDWTTGYLVEDLDHTWTLTN